MTMNQSNTNLALNWHFTDYCNMKCRYCFAPIGKKSQSIDFRYILDKISTVFSRVNFVGGEPTTSNLLLPMIRYAKNVGLNTSIVTNGYNLFHNKRYTEQLLPVIDSVGISIDSLRDNTNCAIGRTVKGKSLSRAEYLHLCHTIKAHNRILKINTVVSKYNLNEDFNSFYEESKADKIKLFQVLAPCYKRKQFYQDVLITKAEFFHFVERHQSVKTKLFVEDNDAMTNSYIILNSRGQFVDNNTGTLSDSIYDKHTDITTELAKITVDLNKYTARYIPA